MEAIGTGPGVPVATSGTEEVAVGFVEVAATTGVCVPARTVELVEVELVDDPFEDEGVIVPAAAGSPSEVRSEFTEETAEVDDAFEVEPVVLELELVIGVTDPNVVDVPTLTIVGDCAGKVELVELEDAAGVEVVGVAVVEAVVVVFVDVPTFVDAITFDPLVPPDPEVELEPELVDPAVPLDDPLETVLEFVDAVLGTSKSVYRGELVSGSSPLAIPNAAGETLRYLTSADLGTHT